MNSLSSFPQNSVGFGEAGERSAMLRARCSPRPNDSSFYNLEFLSEQPNYRRREGLLLLHAAADSVETWLYFSQSLSPDLDPFVRLSALCSRSPPRLSSTGRTSSLSFSLSFHLSRDPPNDPLTTQIALRRPALVILSLKARSSISPISSLEILSRDTVAA